MWCGGGDGADAGRVRVGPHASRGRVAYWGRAILLPLFLLLLLLRPAMMMCMAGRVARRRPRCH